MRGNEGRWLAPSATPWDDAGEKSLGPAETLVMACHRDLHGYRHAGASPGGEADFLDAYVRDACPRCGSREIEGNGRDRNDIRRRWPRERPRRGHRGHVRIPPHACGRSDGVPARDVLARRPGGYRQVKQEIGDDSPCWLARPLAVLADERCHPPSGRDRRRKADGTRPRGPSGSQACVAIGRDGRGRSHSSRLGPGKPSEPGTRAAYAGHIQRGSHPARDMERSHKALVREPGPTEEAHDSKRIKTLPDKEDPPHGASEPCYLPGLFPSSHSGFDRARSGGISTCST